MNNNNLKVAEEIQLKINKKKAEIEELKKQHDEEINAFTKELRKLEIEKSKYIPSSKFKIKLEVLIKELESIIEKKITDIEIIVLGEAISLPKKSNLKNIKIKLLKKDKVTLNILLENLSEKVGYSFSQEYSLNEVLLDKSKLYESLQINYTWKEIVKTSKGEEIKCFAYLDFDHSKLKLLCVYFDYEQIMNADNDPFKQAVINCINKNEAELKGLTKK